MANENEIEAQAALIYPDYLRPYNIGDTDINWVASDGDPNSVAGASFGGTGYFDDEDQGVVLTDATDGTAGYVYWTKNYDWTKSIIITATTRAGGGDGADGITFFLGGSDVASKDANEGNLAVYADEFNGDIVQVFNSGTQKGDDYLALKTLDDNTYNYWEVVYEYVSSSVINLHVRLNSQYVTRVNVAPWTPGGNYIGVAGVCGSQNNVHSVKSFAVKSARAWLAYNF
jgi:hypothetical protein